MLTLARYDLGDLGEASWLSIPTGTYHDDDDDDGDHRSTIPNRQPTNRPKPLSPRNPLSLPPTYRPCPPLPLFPSLYPTRP